MSRYSSGSLMNILVHSAVAGAGLSIGRDVYKKTRDSFFVLAIATIALGGTAYAFWNMLRGHDRGPAETLFRTILLNAFIALLSSGIFWFILFAVTEPAMASRETVVAAICIQPALALLGAAFGYYQRGQRLRAIAVDRHNADFLDRNGFRDVGGREKTMLGPSGEELVLDDFRSDAVVFKVKGRRSVRAKILLDGTGRMVSYVPA